MSLTVTVAPCRGIDAKPHSSIPVNGKHSTVHERTKKNGYSRKIVQFNKERNFGEFYFSDYIHYKGAELPYSNNKISGKI